MCDSRELTLVSARCLPALTYKRARRDVRVLADLKLRVKASVLPVTRQSQSYNFCLRPTVNLKSDQRPSNISKVFS